MLLSEVVVVLIGLALLTFIPLRLVAELRVKPAYRGPWVANHVALALICVVVIAMAFRSLAFGVDTATYAELFADFCAGHEIDKDEASFTLSAWLLNGVMLGACSDLLFPAAWVGLVVAELAKLASVKFMPSDVVIRLVFDSVKVAAGLVANDLLATIVSLPPKPLIVPVPVQPLTSNVLANVPPVRLAICKFDKRSVIAKAADSRTRLSLVSTTFVSTD